MVGGAYGQCHEGEGGVLGRDGSHAGAISYKDIGAGVHLVPLVEHGSLGVFAHPYASHFVNIQAGGLFGVTCLNVGEARF